MVAMNIEHKSYWKCKDIEKNEQRWRIGSKVWIRS
jgi:hypothetical protein